MLRACLTDSWLGVTVGTVACHRAYPALKSLQSLGARSTSCPGLPSTANTFTEVPEVGLLQTFPSNVSYQKEQGWDKGNLLLLTGLSDSRLDLTFELRLSVSQKGWKIWLQLRWNGERFQKALQLSGMFCWSERSISAIHNSIKDSNL